MSIEILYEDKDVLACVKPAGVVSEEGGMIALLQEQLGGKRVYCVHRLDKEVSGAMLYAKNGKAAAYVSEMLSKHDAVKAYLAIVHGSPEAETGEFSDLLYHDQAKNKTYVVNRMRKGVKEARLSYQRLAEREWSGEVFSLLMITLATGRSHQIRVQFASRKMPVAGDSRYGSRLKMENIALLSYHYAFTGMNGRKVSVKTLPPKEGIWAAFSDYHYEALP